MLRLLPAEAAAAESHLAGCVECRAPCCTTCAVFLEAAPYCRECARRLLTPP